MRPSLVESAVLLGARSTLVAVVTNPAGEPKTAAPVLVLINAGILHRIGPNRMYVELARRVASLGYATVRLDLSGIGDSEPRDDSLSPLHGALADIREALDSLQAKFGWNRFVLGGLCAGADHSVIYAGGDPRVSGTILLDPSIPRTPMHRIHRIRRVVARIDGWESAAAKVRRATGTLVDRIGARVRADEATVASRPDLQSTEARQYLAEVYRSAVFDRGPCLAVFTGDRELLYNYREQILDAFPALRGADRLRLEYLHECGHTFDRRSERTVLFDTVCGWLDGTRFDATPSGVIEERTRSIE